MNSEPKLKYAIGDIKDAEGLSVSFSLSASRLVPEKIRDARLRSPLTIALDFTVGGNQVLLRAKLAGAWIVPCSRCLQEGHAEFESSVEETYSAESASVDVEPMLREAAILEMPQRFVCLKNCKGFKKEWGEKPPKNAGGKSPFAILKKLKKSEQE